LICKGMPHRHVSLRVVARPSVMKQVMNRWEFSCATMSVRFPSVCPNNRTKESWGKEQCPQCGGAMSSPPPDANPMCTLCEKSRPMKLKGRHSVFFVSNRPDVHARTVARGGQFWSTI
jgi:hypothetical protein